MVWYREVFKIVVGAAAWDALIALWLIIIKEYYVNFFGIKLGRTGLGAALFIDLIIIIFLSYFAWYRPKKQKRKISKRKKRK